MTDQVRHHIAGYGEIPRDLARPRDPERARLIATVVIASAGLLVSAGMLCYALLTFPW